MIAAPSESVAAEIAPAVAEATGKLFDAHPGAVWVRFRTLPAADYAENGVNAADTPAPVFVRVLKRDLPEPDVLRAEAADLAAAIAKVCGRPVGSVHMLYEPPGAGRVAFGGRMP